MGISERKEREKEQRREDIISAAERIFFEKGLPTATMDEIAEAAELSKGTLYLYYKSKEDLYLAVALRGGEILYRMFLGATAAEKPILQRIAGLGDAYYEFFKQHRDYFRMYQYFENLQLHKQVSPEMLNTCLASDQRIWGLVVALIQQAIDEGMFERDLNPMEAAIILWSNGNGLMRLMDREDLRFNEFMKVDLETTLRRSYEFIMEGMMTEKGKQHYDAIMKLEEKQK